MAKHIIEHVDGKFYEREFKTGRPKLCKELKSVRVNITLSPQAKIIIEKVCEERNMSFSSWVDEQIYTVSVRIETA